MIGEVIHGDCLEVMKKIPDKAIDLVLTDPPYGLRTSGKVGGDGGNFNFSAKDYGEQKWDFNVPSGEYFEEMFRISKNQVIFGGNYFIEYLKNSPCFIIWDKDNSGNFADCEIAWTSFPTAIRKFKWRWNGMLQEEMGSKKEIRFHPTQKPVELFRWILQNYSKEGDLIFDGFAGSFTTARACKDMGRRWICCDLEEEYCKIGEERLRQELLF